MSKTEFLDPLEAKKFKKQKCVQFCRTPCINRNMRSETIPSLNFYGGISYPLPPPNVDQNPCTLRDRVQIEKGVLCA